MNGKPESAQLAQSLPENGTRVRTGNIKDGRGVAVGEGTTAVHIDALGDVGDVITGTKINLVNQAEARRASRRQIAAPPDGYIPRPKAEAELSAMLTAESGCFRIISLYGLPGVGKSWLVRKVAKGLEQTFEDGTLWANLEQTKFRTAVWHFIEPYDHVINHNSLKSNSEYVAALEEAFGDKRILIVLDQLDNREGLRQWLPNNCPNCVVLLISQHQPPGLQPNEFPCELRAMEDEEALEMFTNLLGGSNGSRTFSDDSLRALAKTLDNNPAAIRRVARDIQVKLTTPDEYLQLLASTGQSGVGQAHLPKLDPVYENLPDDGKALFPLLGILHSVPWTSADLFAISHKGSREIEKGLLQLVRAGLIENLAEGHYRTPATISTFAYSKLIDLGGQALVDATTMLRAFDILRKSEIVLRYTRQAMLKECWQNEANRSALLDSVAQQFTVHTPAIDHLDGESSMLAVPRDPLLDFFENLLFKNSVYANRWLGMLHAADFSVLRHQLEEMFDWAYKQEDWPLLRRFSTNISVNTEWVKGDFEGKDGESSWLKINFVFPLLKALNVRRIELRQAVLKAPNIKGTHWADCQFIASEWPGAYLLSSAFERIDMVGMILPGGVVTGCKFVDVDARYADFRGTVFQKCTFINVNFRGAALRKVKFIDCYFRNVDFRLTHLEASYAKYR